MSVDQQYICVGKPIFQHVGRGDGFGEAAPAFRGDLIQGDACPVHDAVVCGADVADNPHRIARRQKDTVAHDAIHVHARDLVVVSDQYELPGALAAAQAVDTDSGIARDTTDAAVVWVALRVYAACTTARRAQGAGWQADALYAGIAGVAGVAAGPAIVVVRRQVDTGIQAPLERCCASDVAAATTADTCVFADVETAATVGVVGGWIDASSAAREQRWLAGLARLTTRALDTWLPARACIATRAAIIGIDTRIDAS